MNINNIPPELLNSILCHAVIESTFDDSYKMCLKITRICKEWRNHSLQGSSSSSISHVGFHFLKSFSKPGNLFHLQNLVDYFKAPQQARFLMAVINTYDIAISFAKSTEIDPYFSHARILPDQTKELLQTLKITLLFNNIPALKKILENKNLDLSTPPLNFLNIVEEFFILCLLNSDPYIAQHKELLDVLKSDARINDPSSGICKLITKETWKRIWKTLCGKNSRIPIRPYSIMNGLPLFKINPNMITHFYFFLAARSEISPEKATSNNQAWSQWFRNLNDTVLVSIMFLITDKTLFELFYQELLHRNPNIIKANEEKLLHHCLRVTHPICIQNAKLIAETYTSKLKPEYLLLYFLYVPSLAFRLIDLDVLQFSMNSLLIILKKWGVGEIDIPTKVFEEFLIKLFENKDFPEKDRNDLIDYLCTPVEDVGLEDIGGLEFLKNAPLLQQWIREMKGENFIEENGKLQLSLLDALNDDDDSDDEFFELPNDKRYLAQVWEPLKK